MNRFNYHRPPIARLCGDLPLSALTNRLRIPIAVVGIALVAVAGSGSLEAQRIAGLDAELDALQSHVQSAAATRARAERLTATVAKLRAMRAAMASARREAIDATNAIARIGNGLPEQTWLTNVGATPNGTWTIAGRSTRVAEIGTMLRHVADIDRSAPARLVSIAATGRSGHILDFVIGWDERP